MRLFRNDVSEVERLYRDHGSALVLFATSITGRRDQAQDAVHQVFLKLMMDALGLHKTAELVVYAIRNGLVNVP